MTKEDLTKDDMFRIIRYVFIGVMFTSIMVVSFLFWFLLTFYEVKITDAITLGGPGQTNEEMVPGNLTVVNTASVDDLIATEEFLTTQTGIDGTTTIPLTSLYIGVESNNGDVTITADPQIAAGAISGDILTMIGTSNTKKIIFEDGRGLSMSTAVTVGEGDILTLKWDAVDNVWEMVSSDTK